MFTIQEIAADLAAFNGIPVEEALRLLDTREGSDRYHEEWIRANPQTEKEVEEFYRTSRWDMWDLAPFHVHWPYHAKPFYLEKVANEAVEYILGTQNPALRVLDYGAGIGSLSIWLWQQGMRNLDYFNLPCPSQDFARFRASRLGAGIRFVSESDLPALAGAFDVVTCYEVIEHLWDIPAHLRLIRSLLRPGGHFFYSVSFRTNPDDHKDNPSHLKMHIGKDIHYLTGACKAAGFSWASNTHMVVPL